LLALYELEEESRTLKLLHEKVLEQLRTLGEEESTLVKQLHSFEARQRNGEPIPTMHASAMGIMPPPAPAITSVNNELYSMQYQRHSNLRALVTGSTSNKFDMYDHTNRQVVDDRNAQDFGAPSENITIGLNDIPADSIFDDNDQIMNDDEDDDDDASQRMRNILRSANVEEYDDEDEDDVDDDEMD
jgi:hypothetical protein